MFGRDQGYAWENEIRDCPKPARLVNKYQVFHSKDAYGGLSNLAQPRHSSLWEAAGGTVGAGVRKQGDGRSASAQNPSER